MLNGENGKKQCIIVVFKVYYFFIFAILHCIIDCDKVYLGNEKSSPAADCRSSIKVKEGGTDERTI